MKFGVKLRQWEQGQRNQICPSTNKQMHLAERQPTSDKGKHLFLSSSRKNRRPRVELLHMPPLHKLVNTLLFPSRAIQRAFPWKPRVEWGRKKTDRSADSSISALRLTLGVITLKTKTWTLKSDSPERKGGRHATEPKLPSNIARKRSHLLVTWQLMTIFLKLHCVVLGKKFKSKGKDLRRLIFFLCLNKLTLNTISHCFTLSIFDSATFS